MRLRLENGASKTKSIAEPKRRELPSKSRNACRSWGVSSDMGKRRRAREAAIQYHFWRDLQRGETPERIDDFWEFCPVKTNVREFAQPLIEGMVVHLDEIDERIKKYCENYNLDRISAVDRNVLRLAIYEMLYRDDIPPVVSINEAIELAKTFGGAESGKFVNGILDRVRKDLTRPAREPVKKET